MKQSIKFIFIIFLLVLFTFVLMGNRMGSLDQIYNPQSLMIFKGKAYIAQKSTIHVFDLHELKLINQFGKEGKGPGELQSVPMIPNTISEINNGFVTESLDKIIQYSKGDLKIVMEKKKGGMFWNFLPVGENFICTKFTPNQGDKIDIKLVLIDPNLKELKVLHSQSTVDRDKEIIMLRDPIGSGIMDDKIFVEKSNLGFIIDIYDKNGNCLKRIEKKSTTPFPITKEFKEQTMEVLKNDQLITRVVNQNGGWENFKKKTTFTFPKNLPIIRDIKVKNNFIYIMTYTKQNNILKLVIMDLEGEIKKTRDVPFTPSPFFTANALGKNIQLWDVDQEFYYYLDLDEEDEEWTLGKVSL